MTVSGGVASIPGGLEPEAAFALALTSADEALYAAKHGGRDQIVLAQAADVTRPAAIAEPGAGPDKDRSEVLGYQV